MFKFNIPLASFILLVGILASQLLSVVVSAQETVEQAYWKRAKEFNNFLLCQYGNALSKGSFEQNKPITQSHDEVQKNLLQQAEDYLALVQHYYTQSILDSSICYLKKLEQFAQENPSLNLPLPYPLQKSKVCLALNDYPCALVYTQKALKYMRTKGLKNQQDSSLYTEIMLDKAEIHTQLRQYSTAIHIQLELLTCPDIAIQLKALKGLAHIYIQLEQYQVALAVLQKGLTLFERCPRTESYTHQQAQYYQQLGLVYLLSEKWLTATRFLNRAKQILKSSPQLNLYLACVTAAQGNAAKASVLFEELSPKELPAQDQLLFRKYWASIATDFRVQLQQIEQAFLIIQKDSTSTDNQYLPPSIEQITNPTEGLKLCLLKTEYLQKSDCTPENIYQHYLLALGLIDRILLSAPKEEIENILEGYIKTTYEKALHLALQLHRNTKNENYQNDVFLLVEKYKQIKEKQLLGTHPKHFFGQYLPDSNLLVLPQLEEKINLYNSFYHQYRRQKDSLRTKIYADYLVELREKRTQQKTWLQNNYPNYWDYIYDDKDIKIKNIQAHLTVNEQILYLFEASSQLHIFSIDKDSIQHRSFAYTNHYIKDLQHFYQLHRAYPAALADSKTACESFAKQAYELHQNYFAAFIQDSRDLIIIPDGNWWQIPFQSLVSRVGKSPHGDFRNLAYWVKKHGISYQYSLNQWLKASTNTTATGINHRILAMAPSYTDSTLNIPSGAQDLDYLAGTYMGYYYKGRKASARRFVEYAPFYGILHLAVQASSAEGSPQINFSPVLNDSSQRLDYLTVQQVRSLELQSSLLFLQSQTHQDFYASDNLNILRSLAYAGASSVLQGQWQQPELLHNPIPRLFYAHTQSDLPKHKALQRAQLRYLEQAPSIATHPAIWANFRQVGNCQPLEISTPISQIWWYSIPILALLIIGWWGLSGLRQRPF